jgi:hypothetical protein
MPRVLVGKTRGNIMTNEVRVFARRTAIRQLSEEEIGQISGGGPFQLPSTTTETWCMFGVGVETNDDCGGD